MIRHLPVLAGPILAPATDERDWRDGNGARSLLRSLGAAELCHRALQSDDRRHVEVRRIARAHDHRHPPCPRGERVGERPALVLVQAELEERVLTPATRFGQTGEWLGGTAPHSGELPEQLRHHWLVRARQKIVGPEAVELPEVSRRSCF